MIPVVLALPGIPELVTPYEIAVTSLEDHHTEYVGLVRDHLDVAPRHLDRDRAVCHAHFHPGACPKGRVRLSIGPHEARDREGGS